ncbi:aminoglycoside phosphotransferase family protein [Pseudenhygromyxa sp. WMMC2535]|uniref:aminoglycoside phosphotransferase family protein n=1 Tax=Pseudenhygromyxa sp. WMMC2535 TaxID=2712867 RepID=UPI00155557EF|nr:aminoglycoside phosphotransferase family protein [Pseudenhygromyxa sp. WMMC2535]NVB43066.1 aminoglycoside phosphotransferase family protein [Pseudenhygromyxa sp. WMMC2535]
MDADEPPLALRRFVLEQLGPVASWRRRDDGRGHTRVWLVSTVAGEGVAGEGVAGEGASGKGAAGKGAVLKHHLGARGFAQEREALSRWFEGPGPDGGRWPVPRLLAFDVATRALLLEQLVGEAADPSAPGIHEAAGRFLAALHSLPIPDRDPMPLSEALERRWRGWLAGCADALDSELRAGLEAIAPARVDLEGVARVPCHRDFGPHNWLWTGEQLAVIDFEHARADLPAVDFAKLWAGAWRSKPELGQAFSRGYFASSCGRQNIAQISEGAFSCALALHGLASLAWGMRHADADFEAEGRHAIALAVAKACTFLDQ